MVISYADRSPVVEVSGQGLVPVIVDDAEVVADSTRILRYLDKRYPEPPLFPSDPSRRAKVDIFLEWFNEVWKRATNAMERELDPKAVPDDMYARMLQLFFRGMAAEREDEALVRG